METSVFESGVSLKEYFWHARVDIPGIQGRFKLTNKAKAVCSERN
jgi:hypothetical protein